MRQSISPLINSELFVLTSNNSRSEMICNEIGFEAYEFIKYHTDIKSSGTFYISNGNEFEILDSFKVKYNSLIDLNPIQKSKKTNDFINKVNEKLLKGGLFVGRFESVKINANYGSAINQSNINKDFRKKLNLYGRLYFFGFEIISEQKIESFVYFVAKKINNPSTKPFPSASPIIKLDRIGKDGKIIVIYKLRTMYPYSEYLQDYIYKNNNLDQSGKFKDDSRIFKAGKIMRKYWIDELPMLINLIRGEIKLFGVRPLSAQYFELYTEELKQLRIKFKPGLIPPYYADMPKKFEEILNSEKKYLLSYQKNPYITDLIYLMKVLYNIIIKRKRSK